MFLYCNCQGKGRKRIALCSMGYSVLLINQLKFSRVFFFLMAVTQCKWSIMLIWILTKKTPHKPQIPSLENRIYVLQCFLSFLLFWNLSQESPAKECVCIPVVLLNQTGLQHSILFLDSRLPFLSCKKYSSASGWQAINFLKCVRPRFSTSIFLLLCPAVYISFLGERERGNEGTDFNSCIRFFNSQIFSVTRFIHLLCSAAYAALLIVCRGWTALVQAAEAWDGQIQPPAGLVTSAALSACPKISPRGSAVEE